jgi:hypothetical protein
MMSELYTELARNPTTFVMLCMASAPIIAYLLIRGLK